VRTARDGREAFEVVNATNPSILVTDWNMPGMTGLELCRSLRRVEREAYLYVLMVTSREDRKDVIQAIDAGADDFLPKPVKEHELVARLRHAHGRLQRLRHYAQLAETDPLTGVMNRRRFDEHCVREIARAARNDSPLSCVLLDLDHFKHINDQYGHTAGDAVLRSVAKLLKDRVRAIDYLCRYGGDEFCLLLPGTSIAEAHRFAEHIRSAIAALTVASGDRILEARATAGVAHWRRDVVTPQQLVDLADAALLQAKRSGRDCVVAADQTGDSSTSACDRGESYAAEGAKLSAGDIMTTPIVTVRHDEPLQRAADLFVRFRIASVPVVDEACRLVGIVGETDVLKSVCVIDDWNRTVGEVMTGQVVSFKADTPLDVICDYLRRCTVRRVVIVENDTPVGVISCGAVLRWLGNWYDFRGCHDPFDACWDATRFRDGVEDILTSACRDIDELRHQVDESAEEALPRVVVAATCLQERAEELLAHCQLSHHFTPGLGSSGIELAADQLVADKPPVGAPPLESTAG
jgi:diguanylate cyclase (GGDEF)-like protein